ncbi:MAG: DinB family protein [Cyclobacteriaceae bacterium]|nr:DinB family protein [Cyclobacteriaceae bacterium]
MNNVRILRYVDHFREVYDGSPWYGDNIVTKLGNLTDDTALARPVQGMHSVGEVVSHMTYWRQSVISRLQKDSSFQASVNSEDNWKDLARLKAEGWEAVHRAFVTSQEQLVRVLSQQSDDILDQEYSDGRTYDYLIRGVINHDVYHLGQIGLIRKFVTG